MNLPEALNIQYQLSKENKQKLMHTPINEVKSEHSVLHAKKKL